MFNKKNDPLVESVKAVMKQNEVHRQAEAALNEELGISSKKALPHEYHAQYDALLEAKVKMTPVTGNQDEIDVSGPKGKPDNMVSKHDFEELGSRSKRASVNEGMLKGLVQKLSGKKKPKNPFDDGKPTLYRELKNNKPSGKKSNPFDDGSPPLSRPVKSKQLEERKVNPYAVGMAAAKKEAGLGKKPAHDLRKKVVKKGHEIAKAVERKLEEEAPTGRHRVTRNECELIARSAGHKNRDTLTTARDEIYRHLNSGASSDLLDSYNKNPRNKETHEKIYKAAVTKRELDEAAKGNMTGADISGMPKPSKGLEDRKVQVPQPFTKPANPQSSSGTQTPPEPKKMDEASYGGKLVKAIKSQRNAAAESGVELNPSKTNLSLAAREIVKKDKKPSMKKSVIAEIRENLEANLIAIHESGDDELFENYVNSLTEEELEILGLNERRTNVSSNDNIVVGDAESQPGGFYGKNSMKLSKRDNFQGYYGTPPESAPPAPPAPPAAVPTFNVAGVAVPLQGRALEKALETDMGGYTGNQIPKTPDAPAAAPAARPAAPAAPAARTPVVSTQQTSRPMSVAKPADTSSYSQRVGDAYRSGSEFTSRGERNPFASMSESKQIKESLESFVRNRFLKG